jgi:hypothetical protein
MRLGRIGEISNFWTTSFGIVFQSIVLFLFLFCDERVERPNPTRSRTLGRWLFSATGADAWRADATGAGGWLTSGRSVFARQLVC